jgi:hypothetical protein
VLLSTSHNNHNTFYSPHFFGGSQTPTSSLILSVVQRNNSSSSAISIFKYTPRYNVNNTPKQTNMRPHTSLVFALAALCSVSFSAPVDNTARAIVSEPVIMYVELPAYRISFGLILTLTFNKVMAARDTNPTGPTAGAIDSRGFFDTLGGIIKDGFDHVKEAFTG